MPRPAPLIPVVDEERSVRRAPSRFFFVFRSASNQRRPRTTSPGTAATPRLQLVTATRWPPRLAILVFSVVVLGGLVLGWEVGRQARRACESIARERHAPGERQDDVTACLAARLLSGGA
jgi:hypothetical protein